MKNIRNTIKSAFFAVALLLLSSVVTHAGFGISPSDFNVNFLQPGSTYTKTYLVSRSGDLGEANIVVEPDMGEVNDWLEFSPSRNFKFAKGARTLDFKVTIKVPQTAEYKEYPGSFTIRTVPADADVRGVTIAQGLKLDSDIKVTEEEIINLSILNMKIEETQVGKPVIVKLTGENMGNVNVAPTLKLTIKDLQENVLEEHTIDDFEMIESGITKEIRSTFKTELKEGEYFVDAEAFLGEESLRKETLALNIVKKAPVKTATTEKSKGTIGTFIDNNSTFIWIILIAIVVAILVLVLINVFWKKRENDGKSTDGTGSVAGGSKQSTRVALAVAFGMLTTFALITNSVSKLEVKETPVNLNNRNADVQGVSDSLSEDPIPALPRQPMLEVVESMVKAKEVVFNVHEEANEDSNVVYEAENNEGLVAVVDGKGNPVTVKTKSGLWYKVKLTSGELGWVSESNVQFVTTRNQ